MGKTSKISKSSNIVNKGTNRKPYKSYLEKTFFNLVLNNIFIINVHFPANTDILTFAQVLTIAF